MSQSRTIEQHRNRVWLSNGNYIKLRQMTDRHLINLLGYLEKKVEEAQEKVRESAAQDVKPEKAKWQATITAGARDLVSYLDWVESVEVEMACRDLKRDSGPEVSPLTEDEKDFLQLRMDGVDHVEIFEQVLVLHDGKGHHTVFERYKIVTDMNGPDKSISGSDFDPFEL